MYYVFSFCNGELMDEEIFKYKSSVEQFLNNNKYLEDLCIIKGKNVTNEFNITN